MTSDVPDNIVSGAQTYAEQRELSVDDVMEQVLEAHGDMEGDVEGDRRWKFALRGAKQRITEKASMGGGGESVTLVSIGHGGLRQWTDRDHDEYVEGMGRDESPKKDVLIANAIIRQDDNNGYTSRGTVIVDSTDDVDMAAAFNAFGAPKNVIETRMSVSESEAVAGALIGNSTSDTEFDVLDDHDFSDDDLQGMLDRSVDDTTIADIARDPKGNLSQSNEYGPVDFGVDVKRLSEATLQDYYIDDNGEWGVYTLLDDSIVGDHELEGTALDSDRGSAGLSGWAEPDMMEYDSGSFCDVYGVLQENDKGEISMSIRGLDPVLANPMSGSSSDAETTSF